MQIQFLGVSTLPQKSLINQNRKQSSPVPQFDSVSFGNLAQKGEKLVKPKSLFSALAQKFARMASPIKLPKVETFDELISRLKEQGKKFEIVPSTFKEYKNVKIYNSSSEKPAREYRFRGNNSLYSIEKNNANGERLSTYIFRKDGSPAEVKVYDLATNRTKAYAEFKRSEINFVKLNPATTKYFEEIEKVKYTKDGKWIKIDPETEMELGKSDQYPGTRKFN